jgi:hypothetical protein
MPAFSHDKGHVFVAWFVTDAMTGLFDEIDRTIVLMRILSEEDAGRWGYSPPGLRHRDESLAFHVDADDTAYVIRTLQRLGVNREPKGLLSFYREHERLFVTFDAPGPASLATEPSLRSNLSAHVDVNANVFLALKPTHFDRLIDYELLRSTQDPHGYWASYFYPSKLFAMVMALDVLDDRPQYGDVVRKALAYVVAAQNTDGSWGDDGDAHETAMAVTALAGRPEHAAAMRSGIEWLSRAMAPDGSWSSDASVWEFIAGEDEVWRAYDTHRTYVTARCLKALRAAPEQLRA